MSTAQSTQRSKEVGVRKVLGSEKRQLFRQFMAETFIVSGFALLIGASMSFLILPYFNTLFDLELSINGLLNTNFLIFILLVLVSVTLFAGSYPGVLLAELHLFWP
ncbi:FtsX-like permease family protein [Maribacter litopenaei]|uniref:FtsX-like permease family protein n=1 Tax=Maribacter litopenaei TaxID=2976127 RepID=A0ABY5YCS1_9FLAO|nr:FtsX-like permease family protein [Maribacter litopenaei]UWX56643.1 FtsX-like permease family protein [Maribacter litopenaei]